MQHGGPVHPSGQQVALSYDNQSAVVVEVGGGLREYRVGGIDVVDGYAEDERARSGRGLPLVPWPNRLHRGRYTWDGEEHRLPVDDLDGPFAVHGLGRPRNWSVRADGPHAAVAALRLHPQEGYPFTVDVEVRYALGPGGLTVTTTATNLGAQACPWGHGTHPYVTVGTELVDDAVLDLPAATRLVTGADRVPTGTEPVEGTRFDLRGGRRIGDALVDDCFTDLDRDGDGVARVVLSSPETGRSVTVWMDAAHPWVMVFTADTVQPPSRRRRSLAVEPMTCPPNAFATGRDVVRIEPGQTVTSQWGISAG